MAVLGHHTQVRHSSASYTHRCLLLAFPFFSSSLPTVFLPLSLRGGVDVGGEVLLGEPIKQGKLINSQYNH